MNKTSAGKFLNILVTNTAFITVLLREMPMTYRSLYAKLEYFLSCCESYRFVLLCNIVYFFVKQLIQGLECDCTQLAWITLARHYPLRGRPFLAICLRSWCGFQSRCSGRLSCTPLKNELWSHCRSPRSTSRVCIETQRGQSKRTRVYPEVIVKFRWTLRYMEFSKLSELICFISLNI